jgi:phosphoenolpyruvate carboxylase
VGYGKPPIPTRFKKGVSGNPKGRPKGSLNVATVFTKTLLEKVVINEHGQRRTVTKLEAALKQLTNKAASGDLRAVRQLVELARDAEAKQKASAVQRPTTDEFDQEVIDGIVKRVNREEEESQTLQEADYVEDQRS